MVTLNRLREPAHRQLQFCLSYESSLCSLRGRLETGIGVDGRVQM
jgi:hypothetical protein